jgi:replicative DNA helicase
MQASDIKNIESEAGIIASIIIRPELILHSENLKSNHFSDKANAYLYYAVSELVKRGIKKVDAYTITNLLNAKQSTQKFTETLTIPVLNDLFEIAPTIARNSTEEYRFLVANVLDSAYRRETYRKLAECMKLCLSPPDGENVQTRIYSEIEKIICKYQNIDDIKPIGEIIDGIWFEIQKGRDSSNFVDFKFPSLNEFCRLSRGSSVVIAGREKRGKSLFVMNCAIDALKRGLGVIYIDTEISTPQFLLRVICHLTGIEYANLRDGSYSESERQKIEDSIAWLKKSNFCHVYTPVVDDDKLISIVKQYKYTNGLDLVCFDYLKSNGVYSLDAYKNSAAMAHTMDVLQNIISGEMNLMCLTAAQATAGGFIAGSAGIARNCSTLIYIERKEHQQIEADGGMEFGNMFLQVKANRIGGLHGDDEYISLMLDGNRCTFTESKQPEPKEQPY